MSQWYSDLMQRAGEVIGLIMGGIGLGFLAKLKSMYEEGKKCRVGKIINNNAQVLEKLIEIRTKLNADRVKMFQFYNGEYFSSGESAVKCSLTHLTMRQGVAIPNGISSVYKEMFISRIIEILSPLLKKPWYFNLVDSSMPESEWKLAMQANGSKSVLYLRVSLQEKIYAVIKATFQDEIEKPTQLQIDEISDSINGIAFLLRRK